MEDKRRIGKYIIDQEIAQSSICSIYRATEESLQRPVLIKKLHPQMAREEDIRTRFEREAKVCAHVKHENIVSIYGYHAEPDLSMLALEFIDGLNLGTLIKDQGRIEWEVTLTILFFVLKGLSFAHSKGVIHRDLKPDNILISYNGQVKIADFGLATLEDAPKLTRQGMVLGTPAYLPPEGLTGAIIDARSDLFSLGATFYETLTGVSPFYGENFSETMNKILKLEPERPSALCDEIPPEMDQIILRLIEKQPTLRYASADQALEDMNHLGEQRKIVLDQISVKKYIDEHHIIKLTEENNGSTVHTSITPLPEIIPTPAPISGEDEIIEQVPSIKRKGTSHFFVGTLLSIAVVLVIGILLLPLSNLFDYIAPVSDTAGNQKETGLFITDTSEVALAENIPDMESNITKSNPEPNAVSELETISKIPYTPPNTKIIKPADTMVVESEREIQSAIPGRLRITTKQWANVFIDDIPYGQTPLMESIELSPGKHRIMLSNDEFPDPVFLTKIIKPDSTLSLDVDLTVHFAIVRILSVKPWAEIFVDNTSYGLTPRARPIFLRFGTHVVELHNPDYQPWKQEYTISAGDNQIEISVELKLSNHIGKSEDK